MTDQLDLLRNEKSRELRVGEKTCAIRWRNMSSVFHMVHAGFRRLKKISTAPVPHRSTWTRRSVMFNGAEPWKETEAEMREQ
jgi:hypothetical protein